MLVRDIGKTNCLTEIPQDIDLRFKEFVQPVLTENGTMGGDSFACDQSNYYTENSGDEQKAWYVFDGKFNGQEWQVNGVKLDTWYWLSWYNPQPIKMSRVGVTNAAGQYSILAWKLQGSNNNSTWTDLTTGTNENVSSVTTWYMEIPEEKQSFYKYYRIYCQPRVTTALMIRELTLTAVEPTIVLKAGSKVYPAYGTLGNSNTTTSDITATNTSNGQYMVIRSGLTAMYLANINSCLSGAVANRPASLSTNTGLYFATDENKMYLTGNGGVDWYSGSDYSLPLAIVTVSNGAISSIDQVFNGFGFIGSTFYALPGVKGFNPNGFENGAYANRERILGNVAIYTNTNYVSEAAFGFNGTQIARWSNGYEEVDELPDVKTVKALRRFYVRPENKIYTTSNNTSWLQETSVFAGYLTIDSTAPYNITSLTVNPVRTKNDSKPYILTRKKRTYYKEVVTEEVYECFKDEYGNYLYAKVPYEVGDVTYYNSDDYTTPSISTSNLHIGNEYIRTINSDGSIDVIFDTIFSLSGDSILVLKGSRSSENDLISRKTEKVESTSSDYDFYEDTQPRYLFARTKNKKYYKYTYEDWTQPVLTSNTSSTLMAVSATNEGHQPAWKAFDGDDINTAWNTYDGVRTATLTINFSDTLAISKIEVVPRYYNDSWRAVFVIINNKIMEFNNAESVTFNYDTPLITNILELKTGGYGWTGFNEVKITAQKQVVVEGSVEDYDYVEYEELKFY